MPLPPDLTYVNALREQVASAHASLTHSLSRYGEIDAAAADWPIFRSAVVKDFELAYELAVKLLYKLVDHRLGRVERYKAPEVLFKEATELGFARSAGESPGWPAYRELRNRTVHVYDGGLARSVADGALGAFLGDLDYLLTQASTYYAAHR